MKLRKIFFTLFFLTGILAFAQQNAKFVEAKNYFDKQRILLGSELKKKYDQAGTKAERRAVEKDFAEFMEKLDSIQNTNLIAQLIRVKNREDLEFLTGKPAVLPEKNPNISEKSAEFPGGINALRQQLVKNMYYGTLDQTVKSYRTEITFIVDRDGYITNVKAEGENPGFNRQAEIAMYMIRDRFSPAISDGLPVRYRFRVPVSLKFE